MSGAEAIVGEKMEYNFKIGTDRLSDIPQNVREEIVRDVGNFAVAIFGITTHKRQSVKLCGSGTLVFASGSHYILTAAHVWAGLLSFDQLALSLKENEPHCFTIPLEHITPHSLGPGQPRGTTPPFHQNTG